MWKVSYPVIFVTNGINIKIAGKFKMTPSRVFPILWSPSRPSFCELSTRSAFAINLERNYGVSPLSRSGMLTNFHKRESYSKYARSMWAASAWISYSRYFQIWKIERMPACHPFYVKSFSISFLVFPDNMSRNASFFVRLGRFAVS